MNETMPRFKMRGARPIFHKIRSNVSIYADRKTHFLSTRERLVKSSFVLATPKLYLFCRLQTYSVYTFPLIGFSGF